ILIPTMHINQSLKSILLSAIKEPINWTFLIDLTMILEKIVQEVVSNNFPTCRSLSTESISNKIKIGFHRIVTVYNSQKLTYTSNNVVIHIFLISNWDYVIFIGYESSVF